MRGALVALAALAAAPGPVAPPASAPTQADAAFAMFRDLCLEHRGQPEESLRQAARSGWMPVPRMMRLFGRPEFSQPGSKWRSSADGYSYLAAGREPQTFGPRAVTVTYCVIGLRGGGERLAKTVETWVGVAPSANEPGSADSRFFAFAETDGRHTALDGRPDAEIARLFEAGRVSFVMTGKDDDMVYAVYMTQAPTVLARAPAAPAAFREGRHGG